MLKSGTQVKSRVLMSLALLVVIALNAALPLPGGAAAASPTFVATFHSIGIYWSPSGGSASNACNVRYRAADNFSWREGLPLWFDSRNAEYRGSLVHLQPAYSPVKGGSGHQVVMKQLLLTQRQLLKMLRGQHHSFVPLN